MTFRAEGTSVVRDTDQGVAGVAIVFDPDMAARIAEALNESQDGAAGGRLTDPLTGEQVARVDVQDARPLSEVLRDGRYVKIVGPYATALMDTPGGRQVRSLSEGSIVPGDVTAGHARHLIDVGLAQMVEAKSARDAFEGAPTERHRVEMTDPNVIGPTVGQPARGSLAAQYGDDPVGTAQRAARAGTSATPVVQLSGAGEAFGADPEAGERRSGRGDGRPTARSSKEEWVRHAVAQRAEGTSEEDARREAEGMSKEQLIAEYGQR